MAPGMKKWIGFVVFGLAVIAVWALPPRSMEEGLFGVRRAPKNSLLPETQAFNRVDAEVRRLGGLYQYGLWADSLQALAESTVKGDGGWVVAVPQLTPPQLRGELVAAVRRRVSALGSPAPMVPVGAVVMDAEFGLFPRGPWQYGSAGRGMVFTNRSSERPFCFMVVSEAEARAGATVARLAHTGPYSDALYNPLGPCVWHARFGMPGAGISRWLEESGYRFAEAPPGSGPGEISAREDQEVRRIGSRTIPRLWTDGRSCASGNREGCLRALLGSPGFRKADTGLGRVGEGTSFSSSSGGHRLLSSAWGMAFGGAERTLLADLEGEFGPDRFQAFWASSGEVTAAFEQVFGVPIEDWLVGWAQAHWGKPDVGPIVPIKAGLLTFLALGVLMGGALLMDGRGRREVRQ